MIPLTVIHGTVRKCPHCNGQMFYDDRINNPEWSCLQCGCVNYGEGFKTLALPIAHKSKLTEVYDILKNLPEHPRRGDMVRGELLGIKSHSAHIWSACEDCGVQSWVKVVSGEAQYKHCHSCGVKHKKYRVSHINRVTIGV